MKPILNPTDFLSDILQDSMKVGSLAGSYAIGKLGVDRRRNKNKASYYASMSIAYFLVAESHLDKREYLDSVKNIDIFQKEGINFKIIDHIIMSASPPVFHDEYCRDMWLGIMHNFSLACASMADSIFSEQYSIENQMLLTIYDFLTDTETSHYKRLIQNSINYERERDFADLLQESLSNNSPSGPMTALPSKHDLQNSIDAVVSQFQEFNTALMSSTVTEPTQSLINFSHTVQKNHISPRCAVRPSEDKARPMAATPVSLNSNMQSTDQIVTIEALISRWLATSPNQGKTALSRRRTAAHLLINTLGLDGGYAAQFAHIRSDAETLINKAITASLKNSRGRATRGKLTKDFIGFVHGSGFSTPLQNWSYRADL